MKDVVGNPIEVGSRVRLYQELEYYPIKYVVALESKDGEDIVVFNKDPYDWAHATSVQVVPTAEMSESAGEINMTDARAMIEKVVSGRSPKDVVSEIFGMSVRQKVLGGGGKPAIKPELLKKLSAFKKTQPKTPKAPWEK